MPDTRYPSLSIGHLTLSSPLVLAPLAGYSDVAFRLLCREMGASLCYTEMISSHGLTYHQNNTFALLKTSKNDRPLGIQLFGSDPEVMGQAAAIASTFPADLIDINMGCPVRKVVKKGAGAALMRTPELARNIIQSVCSNTHLPVTVKFRIGWTHEEITAVSFAQMAQQAGAQAITIHGRTWSQGFGGNADWKIIQKVKASVDLPVIGNGDVDSHSTGMQRIEETLCDGIMVGRGALGNPWVFSAKGKPETLQERIPVLLRYIELCKKHLPSERMLPRIKNHAGRFFSGLHGAAKIRTRLYACTTLEEMEEMLLEKGTKL